MLTCDYNLSTPEAEAGGSQDQGQPELHSESKPRKEERRKGGRKWM